MPATVRITPRGEDRVRSGHPWIYKSDVRGVDQDASAGAVVRVLGAKDRPLGHALFSDRSQIVLRMVSKGDAAVDEAFWRARLAAAIAFRAALADLCADSCRELTREQWLARPPEEVFPFFSDPRNLERITPDFLRFRVDVGRGFVQHQDFCSALEQNPRQRETLPLTFGRLDPMPEVRMERVLETEWQSFDEFSRAGAAGSCLDGIALDESRHVAESDRLPGREWIGLEGLEKNAELVLIGAWIELSQVDAAQAAGITRIQIRRWETKFRARLLRFLKRADYVRDG